MPEYCPLCGSAVSDGKSAEWYTDPEALEFLRHALDEMAPKMADSALTLSLMPGDLNKPHLGDAKYWVELGASIMYEKPIILLVREGAHIPQKLQKFADEIVVISGRMDEDDADLIQQAIGRVLGDE